MTLWLNCFITNSRVPKPLQKQQYLASKTRLTNCFYFLSQRSASLGIVGFSNELEMELPSRLSRSADPQVQGIATVALGPSPNTRCDCDSPPEPVPSYSLALGRAELSPGVSTTFTPGDVHQGSAKCKVGIAQTPLLKWSPFSLIAHVVVSHVKTAVSVSTVFFWYLRTDYTLFSLRKLIIRFVNFFSPEAGKWRLQRCGSSSRKQLGYSWARCSEWIKSFYAKYSGRTY